MANIRKSFNFSSGVQIDNDNFVVSPVGLVGIGTSVPTVGYKLDVHGNIRSTGLTTTQDLNVSGDVEISGITTVGILTASSIDVANGVNVGGALTAATLKLTNGETVDNLIGYARTTFITDNAGVGLHTTSKIGINTTISPGASDPELSVIGNVDVTGIITATTFYGSLSGDVSGNVNASSGVSTFTELKVGTAITMSVGIITATTFSGSGASLTDIPNTALTNSSVSFGGVSTSLGNSVAQPAFDLTNATNYSYDDLTGISTSIVGDTSPELGGNLTLNSKNVTGTGNFNVTGIITATKFVGALSGTATTATNLEDAANITTGTINNDRLPATPQFTSIGIGTTASSTDALHIQQSGAAEIYVGSDSDASSLRVGRNLDDNTSGVIRYGNTSVLYPYSTENSLDFMNFGQGDVNFYVEAGTTTSNILNFNWILGNNDALMTLTEQGNLGIGITNPSQKLSVQGISTFTDDAHFNENVTVNQNLTIGGNLTFGSEASITATFRGNLQSADGTNIVVGVPTDSSDPVENAEVKARIVGGASTITKLDITGTGHDNPVFSVRASGIIADSVGDDIVINVNNAAANKFVVNSLGGVGIGTTNLVDSLDMIYAQRPAVFPNMTTEFRDVLAEPKGEGGDPGISTSLGSIIYNTTDNKLQVYNGTSWVDLH